MTEQASGVDQSGFGEKPDHTPDYEAMDAGNAKGMYVENPAMAARDSPSSSDQTSSELTSEMELEVDDGDPCSWGPFKPSFCQKFRNPKTVLLCLCCAGLIQGMIVNGFVSVVITSLERRFDMASTETGMIASFYDIAAVICLIPVSYYGGFGRKPRYVGTGIFFLGIGSLLFALPHFTTGIYNYKDNLRDLNKCYKSSGNTTTAGQCSAEETVSQLSTYKYVFALANILHGAGATSLFTLGITYMDENVKPKMTPVYSGIFYAMCIIGPAMGYMFGGELLKRYTDIDTIDTPTDITPESPMWVGAWWIGFLISGILAIIISIPLIGFPKSLPGSARLRAERMSEACLADSQSGGSQSTFDPSAGGIAKVIKVLITNPTFMFLNCAGASEGLLVSGFTAFLPKFIESQFSLSAGIAAQLVGFATIPTGGGGTFLGGYLVKKLDLKCPGILKLCLCTSFMSLMLMMMFFIGCPNVHFAGVNVEYSSHNRTAHVDAVNLTAACNKDCNCIRDRFDPVCGVDNVMYYSPCYAGCTKVPDSQGKKMYLNCSCVGQSDSPVPAMPVHGMAQEGKCPSDCQLLALFLPMFALAIFTTFCTSMPALSATLRCVPEQQTSLALGIQWILVRCLGSIPAPIFFGALIDKTCLVWQNSCESKGTCLFYNNASMGHYLLLMAILGKGLAFFFFFMALTFYHPAKKPIAMTAASGDPLSQSSSVAMINKEKCSIDSKLSGVSNPATRQADPESGNKKSRLNFLGANNHNANKTQPPTHKAPQKSTIQVSTQTGQAKYKLVPQ